MFNAFRGNRDRRPLPQPAPRPREEEELLSRQPTHITPIVNTTPSRANLLNNLSEDDLQKLIRQLEAVQKDPKNAEKLDLSPLKKLQNTTVTGNNRAEASNKLESVQIITPGSAGSRSRSTARTRGRKATTPNPPVSVTNELQESDYVVPTTDAPKVATILPPIKLTPLPGVPEGSSPRVRGQLINAAVNVTKAISSFFGTALQVHTI